MLLLKCLFRCFRPALSSSASIIATRSCSSFLSSWSSDRNKTNIREKASPGNMWGKHTNTSTCTTTAASIFVLTQSGPVIVYLVLYIRFQWWMLIWNMTKFQIIRSKGQLSDHLICSEPDRFLPPCLCDSNMEMSLYGHLKQILHWSLTHLLFKPSVWERQPIRGKLDFRQGMKWASKPSMR